MSNNPLKQYFRRPSIYIKLPSNGVYYTSSEVEMPHNSELPVYPMTAIDEMTAKTPDAVLNGQAVVDIIQSCVPNIKNAWVINNIDLETILIAIRIASNGEDMDIGSKCPACETESNYSVNLLQLLNSKTIPDYNTVLTVNELIIKFKPLSWAETNKNNMAQFEIQKMVVMLQDYEENEVKQTEIKKSLDKLNGIMTDLIVDTIESITTPETAVSDRDYIREFLENCDNNTNKLIRDVSIQLKADSQIKPLNIKCVNCQHEYEQKLLLNITDFFG